MAARQKGFKKGVDGDEARRKREDVQVQLRKQIREEALQKKRATDEVPAPSAQTGLGMADMPPMIAPVSVPMEVIIQNAQLIASADPAAQFTGTQAFRKLLSVEKNPPIQPVIDARIVPRVVQFLREVNRPDLQFEAAWVLTNIASGTAEQTRCVVEHGALPLFVELLGSPNEDVREQAIWALGNIAGDSPNFRDLVLQSGGLSPTMMVLGSSQKTSMMRNATWLLSNLCRGKPPPPFEWVSPALGTLGQLIKHQDVEVLVDACWALSYLTDGPNERIAGVLEAGFCHQMVENLLHASHMVQTPALRAVGNIVTGDDLHTQHVLECGVLPKLLQLMAHPKKAIRKETCWTISNITAGNRDQIQLVIENGLIPPLINALQVGDFDIKKEAAWAISNATSGGSPAQIEYLVKAQCIKPMVELMSVSDSAIVLVALEATDNILKAGRNSQQQMGLAENPCVALVEEADGLRQLEELQADPNEDVYSKAVRILETYFALEDEQDGDGMPQDACRFGAAIPQGGFTFGQVSA